MDVEIKYDLNNGTRIIVSLTRDDYAKLAGTPSIVMHRTQAPNTPLDPVTILRSIIELEEERRAGLAPWMMQARHIEMPKTLDDAINTLAARIRHVTRDYKPEDLALDMVRSFINGVKRRLHSLADHLEACEDEDDHALAEDLRSIARGEAATPERTITLANGSTVAFEGGPEEKITGHKEPR